jgi:beta-lactam-binding protein with PASTA domain
MTWKKGILYTLVPVCAFLLSVYVTIDILLKTGETVVCPDVRGKSVEAAKEMALSAGLSLIVLRYENRNDVPYNHVTVQKPEANISTRKGRIIYVIASEGPALVEVPFLTGASLQEAEKELQDKDLVVKAVVNVPHVKIGKIITQSPKGGDKILAGRGLVLFVGVEQCPYYLMPDIRGVDVADLEDELDLKKIKWRTNSPDGERIFSGSAYTLSIPPGTIFPASQEVLINPVTGG